MFRLVPGSCVSLHFIALKMENTRKTYTAFIDRPEYWIPTWGKPESWTVTCPKALAARPTLCGGHGGLHGLSLTGTAYPTSEVTHNWVFPSCQFVCLTFLRQYSPDLVFLWTHQHFRPPPRPAFPVLYSFSLADPHPREAPSVAHCVTHPPVGRDMFILDCANLKQTVWKCFVRDDVFLFKKACLQI